MTIKEIADTEYRRVMSQREKILEAFVAETGCKPTEAIQIEQRLESGFSTWYVRKKDASDIAREQHAKELAQIDTSRYELKVCDGRLTLLPTC